MDMSLLGCGLVGRRFSVKSKLKQIIAETLAEQCSKCLDNEQERAEVTEAILASLSRSDRDCADDTFSRDKERFMAP